MWRNTAAVHVTFLSAAAPRPSQSPRKPPVLRQTSVGGGGRPAGGGGDPLRAFRRRASHLAPGRPVTRRGAPLVLGAVAFHQFEPSHSRHRVDQRKDTIITGVECTDMLPYKAVICRASLQAAAALGTPAQQIFRHRRDSSCIFPLEFGAGLSKSADILPRGRTARPFQRLALMCGRCGHSRFKKVGIGNYKNGVTRCGKNGALNN